MSQSNISHKVQNVVLNKDVQDNRSFIHKSVLLKETIEALNIKLGEKYIDATIGGGGHAAEIIKRGGKVLGIDQDAEAIDFLKEKFLGDENIVLVQGNFSDIKELAEKNGFEKVAGVIFDLGLSSYQIDQSGRGFSFMRDEALDMRMDKDSELSALEIVNKWRKDELFELFSKYGEERNSRAIADNIERARRVKQIATTRELVDVIKEVNRSQGKIHPATKVFMALRIAVNNELTNLKKGLNYSLELLDDNASMAVISFHSLEDRMVKDFMRRSGYEYSKKPILASYEEIKRNPRSRSAKLRILKKYKQLLTCSINHK